MRIAIVGAVLIALGLVAMATGVLPVEAVGALAARSAPILGFVVAMTIVAELAAEAGVFRAIAQHLARFARGRAIVLWLFVVAMATASTIFLSLDTTAVLLTPVVVSVAAHARISPIPFALTTVWLANTASLLLPVSNLTNLLAAERLDLAPVEFAALMWAPAAVGVLVPTVFLFVTRPRQLLRRYVPDEPTPPRDRVLLGIASAVLLVLVPLLVSGIEVWIPASAAAAALALVFVFRRPSVLRPGLVPWRLLVFVAGLFLAMEAAHELRLTDVLGSFAGQGEGPLELLRLSGVAALSANVADNLPAYLALEPFASSPLRTAALLIGVNAGALITPWASLATLLWHHRLVAMGVEISWAKFAALGCIVAPIVVAGAVLALSATS
ncbi:arsenic transporter [Agromyces endophyticus]|uniref:SLC13 family permease n=1 Tax=Agromyces sp. H17E-10 TaxID=2932244 RepID=UPI001FD29B06|nr:SLC13 family permease [Agromyces sp. H17E-10]UOQ90548.1 arsenic transporter [Agromyces sp. H17E-10]